MDRSAPAGEPGAPAAFLPPGVGLRPLPPHVDDRGQLTELFREEWDAGTCPVQWNAVRTEAHVLRGMHVHVKHSDYLVLLDGKATIMLLDLRQGAPTGGGAVLVELSGDRMEGLTIPAGVGHAFWYGAPSIHVYGVSRYWDVNDELGCHWGDPELGLPAFPQRPRVSARDEALPSLRELVAQLEPWQPL